MSLLLPYPLGYDSFLVGNWIPVSAQELDPGFSSCSKVGQESPGKEELSLQSVGTEFCSLKEGNSPGPAIFC